MICTAHGVEPAPFCSPPPNRSRLASTTPATSVGDWTTCLPHPVWHLESSAAWFTPTSGLARGRELPAGWLEMGGIEDTHGNLDAQGILDSIDNLGAKGADCANRSPRLHLSRLGHAVLALEAQ